MKIGSLFAGIGGLDLGLERGIGGVTVFQAEIEKYPREVLKRRFPSSMLLGDVCEIDGRALPGVDVLCGGPPCQSWSVAGAQRGFSDARGMLSKEYLRILGELGPRFCVIENVPGYKKAMPDIVAGLTELGYTAQWDVIPAAAVGAPHLRERFFIVGVLGGGLFLDFDSARPESIEWPRLEVEPVRPKTPGKRVKGDVARIKALGNAVVPGCAEWVGRAISAAREWRPATPDGRFSDLSARDIPRAGFAGLNGNFRTCTPAAVVPRGQRLPTATASDANGSRNRTAGRRGPGKHSSGTTLNDARVLGLLPTPTTYASAGTRDGANPYVTANGTVRSLRADGRSSNLGLAGMTGFLPTPRAQEMWDRSEDMHEGLRNTPAMSHTFGGPLNPEFVEWMMGFETGWTALEEE